MAKEKPKNLNLPDYPYDKFFEKKNDKFVCLIPPYEEFDTYEKYLKHFEFNNSHFNHIKRKLEYLTYKSFAEDGIIVSPVEDELIKQNIKYDKAYINLKMNRDVTWLLDKQIDHWVKNDEMAAIECVGISGSGKSCAMIALGYYIADKWEDKLKRPTEVFIGFERKDTLANIKMAKKGDVIIQDEDPAAFGSGSQTNEQRLENLLKIMRKKCISFIFVSPVETKVRNIALRFETRYKISKRRITKLILYTRTNLALGYVYIEILDDDNPIMIEYEARKDAFIDKTQLSAGLGARNFDVDEFDADVELVFDLVKIRDPKMKRTRIRRYVAEYVQQSTVYQGWIADEVYERLREDKYVSDELDEPLVVDKRGVKYEWIHTRTETDIGVLNDLYKFAKEMRLDEDEQRGLEAWRYIFIEELSHSMATKELNKIFTPLTRPMYFRKGDGKINKFIQGNMGKAGEFAVQKWFYPNYEYNGERGEPDLFVKDKIVEVKVRDIDDKRKVEQLVARDEYIRDYMDRKENIDIVVVSYGIGEVRIDFYTIVYADIEEDIISDITFETNDNEPI